MFVLVAALLGILVHLGILQCDPWTHPGTTGLAVAAWTLLAVGLRKTIRHPDRRTTLAGGIVLGAIGWMVQGGLGLVVAIRTAAAIQSPAPKDLAIDVPGSIARLLAALAAAVVAAFVLRAVPSAPPRSPTPDQPPENRA
ncbi:MAG: hypothetical protein JNK15_25955 [Planctomycetes bacterium]|nr:hypothetical protein [Planctomycetota bacterium]